MHAAWQSPEDGGARGPRNVRRACAMRLRYLLRKQRYQAQPRGGCCRRCNGARRSKRVGGHAACAAAAHGERAGGSGRCDGEPSRGRCAPARDASLQERVATRRRNLLWGAKWAGGVAEGRRQPYPSSTSGSRCRQATCSSTDERPQANDRGGRASRRRGPEYSAQVAGSDDIQQLVMAFKVFRRWPSEYMALPDLDANAGQGGKKGAPTAVPALRPVPPVQRGSCRGSVVPGSPSGDPATDDPGSPEQGTT